MDVSPNSVAQPGLMEKKVHAHFVSNLCLQLFILRLHVVEFVLHKTGCIKSSLAQVCLIFRETEFDKSLVGRTL